MSNKRKEEKILDNTLNSLANTEVVERYGSANAEFIKGYTGVNNETGQKLQKLAVTTQKILSINHQNVLRELKTLKFTVKTILLLILSKLKMVRLSQAQNLR